MLIFSSGGVRFSFVVMLGLGWCAVVSHWSAFSPRLTWQSSGTGRKHASFGVAGIINISGFVAHLARPAPYFYVRALWFCACRAACRASPAVVLLTRRLAVLGADFQQCGG